jgi:death on curing protein
VKEPRFLTVEDALRLHHQLVETFGGDIGILRPGDLESAVAQPAMTAFGKFLHRDLVEQAAAYLFHLVANHPFCDGNESIGLHAAAVFLDTNDVDLVGTEADWHELTMAVARGEMKN